MPVILNKSDLFKDQSEALINAKFKDLYLIDEQRRMKHSEKRLRMLWDDYECDVKAFVQSLVDAETYQNQETGKGLVNYIDTTNNVYKAIIKQLAMLYKKSPLRDFGKDKKVREMFNQVYGVSERDDIKSSLFDDVFKKANMYVQALNDVYLYFVPRGEQIDIDVLTPNNLIIIPKQDNPLEPNVMMIRRYPAMEECDSYEIYKPGQEYYIVWSDTEHYRLVKDGRLWRKIAVDGNPDMINPYGVLPFVGIHKTHNDMLWNETLGEDLYQIGLWTAAFTTIWNHNWAWHNFKQLAISTDDEIPQELGRSPDRYIKTPSDAKVEALDWSIDTESLFNQIQQKAAVTAAKHGVDLEFTKADAQSRGDSGIKLRIKQSMLKEMRDDQVKTFTKAEMESFEVIKKILGYRNGKDINADMSIKYHDMEVYQDQKETLEILEKEIESDLVSKVDALLQKFPHLTREQAMEKLKQNIIENNELRGMRDQSLYSEVVK
jgi:hypothetical protein